MAKKTCACCKRQTLPKGSIFEICPVCGWEDDEYQNEHPDYEGGANKMSLNKAKAFPSCMIKQTEHTGGEAE